MTKTKASTAVAPTSDHENLPTVAGVPSFEDLAGAGMENVTGADMLVPRLSILQALSPQLNKKKPEFIEGAAIGDIADLGTGELMGTALQFLPVYYKKVWIEWAPRDSGKGLVAIHDTEDCLQGTTLNDRNQPITPEGDYISETHQFFGLNLSADRRRSFISFTSTQIKKARKWNTLSASIKLTRLDGSEFVPPLFYSTYNLGTAEESNASGEWSGWTIDRGPRLEDLGTGWEMACKDAYEFYELLRKGEAQADMSQEEQAAQTEQAM